MQNDDTRPMSDEQALRQLAVKRLTRRRTFTGGHLLAFVVVNGLVIVLWFVADGGRLFWPGILMIAWAVGLVMNASDIVQDAESGEQRIQREMQRLESRRRR